MGSKAKPPLQNTLFDVRYEIMQYVDALSALVDQSAVARDPVRLLTTQNALVESYLLHTRSLLDFFERSTGKKDDIFSRDYGFPTKGAIMSAEYRNDINKHLTHLTYARAEYRSINQNELPKWIVKESVQLLNVLKEFDEFMLSSSVMKLADPREQAQWADVPRAIDKALNLISKL